VKKHLNLVASIDEDQDGHRDAACVDYTSPFESLVKHKRYLSDWSDPVIKIDAAPDGIKEINLADYFLPANNHDEGLFSEPVCLSEFPHWMDTIKAGANQVLFNHNNNRTPFMWVVNAINHMVKFAGWCVINRIYQFGAIDKKDIDLFIGDLLPFGWYKALGMEQRFKNIINEISVDDSVRKQILGAERTELPNLISINLYGLSRVLGVPLRTKEVPAWVYKSIADQLGMAANQGNQTFDKPISPSSLKVIFESINTLSALPDGFDKICFVPFYKPRVLARKLSHVDEGRTENLSLKDATAILGAAVRGVYEIAPAVVEMGNNIRKLSSSYIIEGRGESTLSLYLSRMVRNMYPQYRDEYSLPFKELNGYVTSSATKPSFFDLVRIVQTAATVIVGINHGRRKNEIIGSGSLPYGLYEGCVKTIDSDFSCYRLDIYIEKTIRDWVEMSCNKLVADAVNILEQIRLFSMPLEDERDNFEGREKKLFVSRSMHFSLSGKSKYWIPYDFVNHSNWFFTMAGISKIDFRAHQFRRFFALIYYYRFDSAVLHALSQHLCHFNLDRTRIYVTDPRMRGDAEKIESLYKGVTKENDGMDTILDVVQDEYAFDKIKQIIEGQPTGGGMTKRIRRLYLMMLRNAEFDDASITEFADDISKRLKERGYFPTNLRHGVCWVGKSKTDKLGRCYEKGKINRDRAQLKICSQCPHHFNNENYLQNLESDLDELTFRETNSADLPLAERNAIRKEVKNLSQLIGLEKLIQVKNAELMNEKKHKICPEVAEGE